MPQVSEQAILDALRVVIEPESGQDIVSLGMVTGLVAKDGNIGFAIEVDPRRGATLEPLRKQAEDLVQGLEGVLSVTAVLTAHSDSPQAARNTPAPEGGPADSHRGAGPRDDVTRAVARVVRLMGRRYGNADTHSDLPFVLSGMSARASKAQSVA